MAAHSFSFIAGAYRMTWGGDTLGQTEDGINFEFVYESEPVRGDVMGDSVQDHVYRGGNCHLQTTLTEYNLDGVKAALKPWQTTWGAVGPVGTMAQVSTKAKVLIMTPVAGTPAATVYTTITADQCILAPGFPVNLLLAPRLKRVPIRFQLLPYGALDSEVWFVPAVVPP